MSKRPHSKENRLGGQTFKIRLVAGSPIKRHLSREKSILTVRGVSSSPSARKKGT